MTKLECAAKKVRTTTAAYNTARLELEAAEKDWWQRWQQLDAARQRAWDVTSAAQCELQRLAASGKGGEQAPFEARP